jgi:hypothetical protein
MPKFEIDVKTNFHRRYVVEVDTSEAAIAAARRLFDERNEDASLPEGLLSWEYADDPEFTNFGLVP